LRRIATFTVALSTALVLAVPAFGAQPTTFGNSDDRNGGTTTPGPHCHINLMASANNQSPHGDIITAAIHEGHIRSGLAGAVFQATACP
jgi:hypothetical protein